MEDCAHRGTRECLRPTTVAIFIPVMFLEDVEGQLFADLALTIAIAVTVLPVVAARYLNGNMPADSLQRVWAKITRYYVAIKHTASPPCISYNGCMGVPITGSVLLKLFATRKTRCR